MAREIIHAGLRTRSSSQRATTGFDAFRGRSSRTRSRTPSGVTGVPARRRSASSAHAYARADRAMICWTLGITEHHNAVDNVFALINLSLLTGHVGRYGSGLQPLRGQNNVQGGGDMGAIPNKLPGFQDVENDEHRAQVRGGVGRDDRPEEGLAPHRDVRGDGARRATALYVIGENPAQSEADQTHARELLEGLDHLVVQDIFLTKTAELADVVLPASAAWARPRARSPTASGACSACARRSTRRARRATRSRSSASSRERLGHDWGDPRAEEVWDELRSLSPMHAGMTLPAPRGARRHPVAVPGRGASRRRSSCTRGSGTTSGRAGRSRRSAWSSTTAGRRSSTTTSRSGSRPAAGSSRTTPACRPGGYPSPLHRGEALDISPEDGERSASSDGELVRVTSRRGSVEAPVRIDPRCAPASRS